SMAEDPNIDTVIYGQAYPTLIDFNTPVGQVLKTMPERYPDKVFLIMSLVAGKMHDGSRWGEPPVDPVNTWDGVPFLQGAENSLRAVKLLNDYAEFRRHWLAGHQPVATPSENAETARAMIAKSGGHP